MYYHLWVGDCTEEKHKVVKFGVITESHYVTFFWHLKKKKKNKTLAFSEIPNYVVLLNTKSLDLEHNVGLDF